MASALEKYDPLVYELVRQEEARQSGKIRLIASENYVSKAVMIATGSCLVNKYAEGYANRRYYEGQQVTDLIESLAISRAKDIFKADHANVQPYSGSVPPDTRSKPYSRSFAASAFAFFTICLA